MEEQMQAAINSRKAEGLRWAHAYTVLNVCTDLYCSGVNLIKIRNTHASQGMVWNGAWSKDWAVWAQYPQLRDRPENDSSAPNLVPAVHQKFSELFP